MSDEEIYKIIAQVEGEEKVKGLAGDLAKAEQKLRDVIAASGGASAAAKQYANSVGDLRAKLKEAESAAGIASHKIMALGQTIDDLQYVPEQGLRPIINNVMQISPAAGIALIAIDQLSKHLGDLGLSFGAAHVKTQAEEMEELSKKISKTADETARLIQLEERRRNAQAQQGPMTGAVGRAGDVNQAIADAPYAHARQAAMDLHGDAWRKSVDQNLVDARDEAKKDVAHAEANRERRNGVDEGHGDRILGHATDRLGEAQKKIDDALNQKVTDWLADLAKDPKAGKALVDQLTKQGKVKEAQGLREALKTPEQKEAEAANAREAERVNAGLDQGEIAKKADASSHKAQVDSDKKAEQEGLDELYAQSQRAAAEKERKHKDQKKSEDKHTRRFEAIDQYNGTVRDIAEKAKKAGPSRVIDSAGLADSIQAGVGAKDPQLEMVKELQEANKNLMKILNKPENRIARMG